MSTTKTSVSVPLMPAWAEPVLPYPRAGGMTRSTRLPTVWPTSPLSQPLMTWPTPMGVGNGWPRVHEESKDFLVRQLMPVYWTTRYWPLATFGPAPVIRVLTCSVFGGAEDGICTAGCWPGVAVTVGSPDPPLEVCVPVTPDLLLNSWIMSMTKTSVSLPPTPICELPWAPKASLGGITASTLLPVFWPISAFSRPGSNGPANSVGVPAVKVLPSSLCLVPVQS